MNVKFTGYIEGTLTVKRNGIILHDMSELADFRILDYLYVTHNTETNPKLISQNVRHLMQFPIYYCVEH